MNRKTIFLVRHGQYTNTAVPPNEPDGPLTEKGRQQARLVGQRLLTYAPTRLIHSDLKRAVETADLIAEQLGDVDKRPSALLRECIPSVPAGMEASFANIPADFIAQGREQADQAFAHFFTPPTKRRSMKRPFWSPTAI